MKITEWSQCKTGMRVRCKIDGMRVDDAVLNVESDGDVYICQNLKDGAATNNLRGYDYSWWIGSLRKLTPADEDVTDLETADEQPAAAEPAREVKAVTAATAADLLESARAIVNGDRQKDYGHPADNHACTYTLMSAWQRRNKEARDATNTILTYPPAIQVCAFNIMQKLSRLAQTPDHTDSLRDIIGYCLNWQMILDNPNGTTIPTPERHDHPRPRTERQCSVNGNHELKLKRKPIIDALLAESPRIPAREAARFLFATYPALFSSIENARLAFRKRVGCQGVYLRKKLERSSGHHYRALFTGDALPAPTPFWDATPFKFDTPLCGIIADVHIPFHVPAAVETMVKYILKRGAKDLLLDGDILDHYQVSDFSRVPDVATLTQELKDGKQFFQWLRRRFKGRIVYKPGNHEERFAVKVHKALPDVGRLMDQMTYEHMGLRELGIEIVDDRRIIQMGFLNCLHGHELGRGAYNPVSPARLALNKARECSLVAHWHQKTEQRGRTISDRQEVGFSIGCLCHLRPHYAPINNWQHGGAVYERTDSDGGFVLDNKTIIGGRCV